MSTRIARVMAMVGAAGILGLAGAAAAAAPASAAPSTSDVAQTQKGGYSYTGKHYKTADGCVQAGKIAKRDYGYSDYYCYLPGDDGKHHDYYLYAKK